MSRAAYMREYYKRNRAEISRKKAERYARIGKAGRYAIEMNMPSERKLYGEGDGMQPTAATRLDKLRCGLDSRRWLAARATDSSTEGP